MQRAPFAWQVVLPVALTELVLLVGFGNRYGYHRDELYFRVAGRHLDWGFPDQGPLTPLLGRISEALFGETPRGLRIISALAMAVVVVLAAVLAREFGAAGTGQLVAAAATAASGMVMAVGHLLSTTTFDLLAWILVIVLVARLLGGGDERLWLAVGGVVGVALLNKDLVLLLCASLLLGILLARRFAALRSWWLVGGAGIALLLWAPNLAWQATNGWPQLELAGQIANEDPFENRIALVPFQFLVAGMLLLPLWLAGFRWLVRAEQARPWRALPLAWLVLVAVGVTLGLKPYYVAPLTLTFLAAGGAAAESWLGRATWHRLLVGAGLAASAAIAILLTQPVFPTSDLAGSPIEAVNEDALETVGWPEFVAAVARVVRELPSDERQRAVIVAGNYGEAGALARYGPEFGLPHAYSGHNGFGWWGPPPKGSAPVVTVGLEPASADGLFRSCRTISRFDNGVGLDNEEQGASIGLCAAPRGPWRELWPRIRFLGA